MPGHVEQRCRHIFCYRITPIESARALDLIDKAVLPRSAIFVRTLEVISIKKRQRFSVGVKDFKDAHVGLIDGQVFSFLESDAIEFVRREEDAVVKHMLEFEVGLDL